jgi:dynein heavy chain
MVPTTDTTKFAYSLDLMIEINKPVFFTGSSGVGKSAVIANKLFELKDKGGIVPVNINMSAQTSSGRTQASIEDKLEKKPKKRYGPPVG